jgi:hypothetical protein
MKFSRLAAVAGALILLALIAVWVLVGASAWTGLHDEDNVRIDGSIGEIEVEALTLDDDTLPLDGDTLVEPPGLQVGAAGYDCDDGAFWVAVQNNGAEASVTVELWRASEDGTPADKLDAAAHTLGAGAADRLRVPADSPEAGDYRMRVDTAPEASGERWSAVVAVQVDVCGADDQTGEPAIEPTEEPTGEPTEEPTPEPTEEPTGEPADEPTDEPTEEPTDESTVEPTEEPTDESTVEPTGEPTDEPTVEPTGEPTDEPTPESTEEPSGDPDPEPEPEQSDGHTESGDPAPEDGAGG